MPVKRKPAKPTRSKTKTKTKRPSAKTSRPKTKTTAKSPPAKTTTAKKLIVNTTTTKSAPAKTGKMGRKVLTIDIGGSKVKMLVNGEVEARKARSGRGLTPTLLVELVEQMTSDWEYDCISIGFPGLVGANGPSSEPANLGNGWVAFDFAAAFGKPVKVINDAAMQALGSYEGGRMLYLGFGTGVGSALISNNMIIPLELSNLRWSATATVGEMLGKKGLRSNGRGKWRSIVNDAVAMCMKAFVADYLVVGGGSAKYLRELMPGARQSHNQAAFRGGYRIWGLDPISVQPQDSLITDYSWHEHKS